MEWIVGTVKPNEPIFMFRGKPIIGITGGIGSGKSFVADLFGELGCLVIHADAQVRLAYEDPEIRATLRQWWGQAAFEPGGAVNRAWIARTIFSDAGQRQRLEQLVHPWVTRHRDALMDTHADGSQVRAFVWDTPLLFETGQYKACDCLVFVDAPLEMRLERVRLARGWDRSELLGREKLQMPLDTKRKMSDHVVSNTADKAFAKRQVSVLLSRIDNGLCRTASSDPEDSHPDTQAHMKDQ